MRRIAYLITATLLLLFALASPAAAEPNHRVQIDPDNFVRYVTNEFHPLPPGTTFFYAGEKEGVPTRDTIEVTNRTKEILGVTCTVVHHRSYEDGVLVEDTFDWFAQDKQGNVWYFGEAVKDLDADGNVISTDGSWEAGVDGAQPGIIMLADPEVGDRYQQEVAPGIAEDQARVLSLHASACISYGCFDDLLKIREWTPLEPDVVEHKYYAEGIGFVRGVMVRGGAERSELVRVTPPLEED